MRPLTPSRNQNISTPATLAAKPSTRNQPATRSVRQKRWSLIESLLRRSSEFEKWTRTATDDRRAYADIQRTLRLNDQRANHAGLAVAGNAAVEGVGSWRARREER